MCDSLCQKVTMNGHLVVQRDYAFYRADVNNQRRNTCETSLKEDNETVKEAD